MQKVEFRSACGLGHRCCVAGAALSWKASQHLLIKSAIKEAGGGVHTLFLDSESLNLHQPRNSLQSIFFPKCLSLRHFQKGKNYYTRCPSGDITTTKLVS